VYNGDVGFMSCKWTGTPCSPMQSLGTINTYYTTAELVYGILVTGSSPNFNSLSEPNTFTSMATNLIYSKHCRFVHGPWPFITLDVAEHCDNKITLQTDQDSERKWPSKTLIMKINRRYDIPIAFASTHNNKDIVHLHTASIIAVH